MLKINLKLVANELTPGLESGEYDVEVGATVRDILAQCEKQFGKTIPPGNFDFMFPLFNGKPVVLDDAITKDGTLHLCRIVLGG